MPHPPLHRRQACSTLKYSVPVPTRLGDTDISGVGVSATPIHWFGVSVVVACDVSVSDGRQACPGIAAPLVPAFWGSVSLRGYSPSLVPSSRFLSRGQGDGHHESVSDAS